MSGVAECSSTFLIEVPTARSFSKHPSKKVSYTATQERRVNKRVEMRVGDLSNVQKGRLRTCRSLVTVNYVMLQPTPRPNIK